MPRCLVAVLGGAVLGVTLTAAAATIAIHHLDCTMIERIRCLYSVSTALS